MKKTHQYCEFDYAMMKRALNLANQAKYTSKPNPAVGCVLTQNNEIIGEGFTQPAGSNHAEIQALEQARQNGYLLKNATAYVTLEPCNHHGRTPPCTAALIKSGIKRVVIAALDPNPQVLGKGLAALKNVGISTSFGLMMEESIKKNIGFFNRMLTGRPWIRTKIAATLDGKTALNNFQSQWITNELARNDGHCWRASACAILTGIGTINCDDPHMNARVPNQNVLQPQRIILDSKLTINLEAKILKGSPYPWVICSNPSLLNSPKAASLAQLKAKILAFPDKKPSLGINPRVDLHETIRYLGTQTFNEIHVEAGNTLMGAMLDCNLIDEILLYVSPMTFGNEARGIFQRNALASIKKAEQWFFDSTENLQGNLRIIAKRKNTSSDEVWEQYQKLTEKLI